MGERLGERETELVVAEVFGEDQARHLVGGRRSAVECGAHHREPLLVVSQKLIYTPVEVVKERAVAREHHIDAEPLQPFKRGQVAFERVRGRISPEPYIRGDVEQYLVARKEEPPTLVVQDEVVVRVTGRVDHARLVVSQQNHVSGMQGLDPLGEAHAEPRGAGRCLCGLLVHAVLDQELHEGLRTTCRVPDVLGVLDLPGEHPYRRPGALLQPAGEPDVIGVQVSHYNLGDVALQVKPDLGGACLPRLPRRWVVEARIYYRPPILAH